MIGALLVDRLMSCLLGTATGLSLTIIGQGVVAALSVLGWHRG